MLNEAINYPALGGLGVLVVLVAGLVRTQLKNLAQDRGAGFTLAEERSDEIQKLNERVSTLEAEIERQRREFDAEIMTQRSAKHVTLNELMRSELMLDTIRRLAPACTCGALTPVLAMLERRND